LYKKFKALPAERQQEIMAKYGYTGNINGFIAYIRQEGKGLDLMWLILDPMNPVDPRHVC
jgi:hypothetical protein